MEFKGRVVSIVRRKGSAIKMMNDKKRQEVYKILITPIRCTSYSKGKPIITMANSVIETTQTYWPQYPDKDTDKPFRYSFNPDCDMSDFTIGFYEVIYKELLREKTILNNEDGFTNKEFAGDTMTTVSILTGLKDKYHCLANFWLLPMHIGRTSKSTPRKLKKWSKTSDVYPIEDYMDRFLILLKQNYTAYKELYKDYFKKIESFEMFVKIHMLENSYIDMSYKINQFSIWDENKTKIEKILFEIIKKRAETIANSGYAKKLWEYFFENGLLEYKETYLEPDEYPLSKEIHPYAYGCPKCNRIIANDENYSIPPVCDECSKWD